MSVGTYRILAAHPPLAEDYDPLTATNSELRAEGERRIAERRAQVAQAATDVRKLISDLIDDNERLKREVRRLNALVTHQQSILARSEPARVTYAEPKGATQ